MRRQSPRDERRTIEPDAVMHGSGPSTLRRVTAAVLLFVMMVTGVFGELAAASHASVVMIGGVPVPICGDRSVDGDPAEAPAAPTCCDHCVLGAPLLPPEAPILARPHRPSRAVPLVAQAASAPVVAAMRTPRQSQGPPSRV